MGSDTVAEWDAGDAPPDAALLSLLRGVDAEGRPLLFAVRRRFAALAAAGVDLTQRDGDGTTPLFDHTLGDDAYLWLAAHFAAHGAVDWADTDGISALSAQVKFGELAKAALLLAASASPDTVARVARYGGAALSIPVQAVNVVVDGDRDAAAIAALALLRRHGATVTEPGRADLLQRTATRPRLHAWIEATWRPG